MSISIPKKPIVRPKFVVTMIVLSLTAAAVGLSNILPTHAMGATISASIIADTPSPQLSHSQFVYRLQLQCSAVTDFSCNGVTATIDLSAYPQIEPSTVSFINGYFVDSWDYGTTTPDTLTVNFKDLPAGVSLDMPFEMATYNGTTPDGYEWTFDAELTGDNIDPATTNELTSSVTATAAINVIKRIRNDVTQTSHPVAEDQLLDTPIRYYLDPCDSNNQEYGALWIETGTMVDTLPPNSTYVASQTGGVYDSGTHTVTWTVADGFENQKQRDWSCAKVWEENDKATYYWIDIEYPSTDFAIGDNVTNNVEVTGTPYNTSTPEPTVTSSIEHGFRNASPGGTYSKQLIQSFRNGLLRANYNTTIYDIYVNQEVRYVSSLRNTGDLEMNISSWTDPIPCLDNITANPNTFGGTSYISNSPGDICANPAIDTSSIRLENTYQGAGALYRYGADLPPDWAPTYTTNLGNTGSFIFDDYVSRISGGVEYLHGSDWVVPSSLSAGEYVAEINIDQGLIQDTNRFAYFYVYGNLTSDLVPSDYVANISTAQVEYSDGQTANFSDNQDIDVIDGKDLLLNKKRSANPADNRDYEIISRHIGSQPEDLVIADLMPFGFTPENLGSIRMLYTAADGNIYDQNFTASTGAVSSVNGNNNIFDPSAFNIEWIENYAGTAQTMLRITTTKKVLPSERFYIRINTNNNGLIYGTQLNTARLFYADGSSADRCFETGNIDVTATHSSTVDVNDWDGDGVEINDQHCWSDHAYDFGGTEALLSTQKYVQGDLDDHWQAFPNVASISDTASTAQFKFEIRNLGAIGLEDPVFYDVFHNIGDTGVSEGQSGTSRDTEWVPTLASIDSLPADAVIEYSTAAESCRGEIADPSTTMTAWPAGCTNDWSITAPSPIGNTSAIRVTFPGVTIGSGDFREVEWSVDVPPAGVNPGEVAWNSAAATATRSDTGNPFLPTEPPKVGVAPPQTDVSLAKTINGGTTFLAGTPISTTITVSHDGDIIYNADGSVTYVKPVSTARELVIEDLLPAGATYIANSASTQACGTWDETNQQFLVDALAPGADCSATFEFTAPATAGTYTNYAEVVGMNTVTSGDDIDSQTDENELSDTSPPDQDDEASAPFTVETPAIELSKQVEDAPGSGNYIEADATDSLAGQYIVGQPINYRFVITNPTGFEVTNLSLTDDLTGFFCNQTIATLSANDSVTIDCTWPYGWLVSEPNAITNTATVTGTATSGGQDIPLTDTDTADVIVKAPYTATLGDYVWTDTNADGVQGAGETGIDGVTVNLLDSAGNPALDSGGSPITTITGDNPATTGTTETGWYSFNITDEVAYQVQVDTSTLPAGLIPTYDQDSGTANPDNISDTSTFSDTNTEDLTLDFGYVAGASIGNYVWNDTNNSGLQDGTENGIDGVTVNLLLEDSSNPGTYIPALDNSSNPITTTTGDNPSTTGITETGWYSFTNLLPGNYQVEFITPTDYTLTTADANSNADDTIDSDATTATTTNPTSPTVALAAGDNNENIDAGFYQPIDLTVSKTTTSTGPYYPGNTPNITYDIVVTNLGPGTTTNPELVVTDQLPTGLSYVNATGTDWTCANASGTITCTRTATASNLAATDTTTTITIEASVDSSASGDLTNLVKVDPSTSEVTPESTPVGTDNNGYETGDPNTDSNNDNSATVSIGELASIGNYVWNDTNNSGLQDGTENGIDGVTVNLLVEDPANPGTFIPALDSSGNAITTVTGDDPSTAGTTETGWYEFTNLLPGSYQVEFITPANYTLTTANANSNANDTTDSDATTATTTNPTTGTVILTAGENDETIDAGFWQPSSLGNYVWNDTNNNGIQDSTEAGIDNVTVTLLDSAGNTVATTITGDNPATTGTTETGWYEFTDLIPGNYIVVFTDPSGYTLTTANVNSNANDTTDSDATTASATTSSMPVTLSTNENNDILDTGYWQPASLGDYLWIDTNSDGVQDTGENPLVGVQVNLLIEDSSNPGSFIPVLDGSGNPVTDITDGSGGYSFTDLPAGNYQVEVEVFTLPNPAYVPTYDLDNGTISPDHNSGTVTLNPGDNNTDADFGYRQLSASITLDKLVKDPSTGNYIDTDTLNPSVEFYEQDTVEWQLVVTNTGEQDLSEVTITDALANSCNTTINTLAVGGQSTIDCTSEAPEGDTMNTATITATPALSGNPSDPTTRVQDQAEEGITAIPLGAISGYTWLDQDSQQDREVNEPILAGLTVELLDNQGNVLSSTTTNDQGYYQFTGLRPGEYQVRVSNPPVDHTQTYDNDGEQTSHIIQAITLGQGQVLSGQDFGYVDSVASLSETGSNTISLTLVGVSTIAVALVLTRATKSQKIYF